MTSDESTLPEYLTTRQVRERYGVSENTVSRYLSAGRYAGTQRGPTGQWWIPAESAAAAHADRAAVGGALIALRHQSAPAVPEPEHTAPRHPYGQVLGIVAVARLYNATMAEARQLAGAGVDGMVLLSEHRVYCPLVHA